MLYIKCIVKNGINWFVNGEEKSTTGRNVTQTVHSVLLFSRWYNATVDKKSTIRLYSFLWERNNNKIQNLIPCYRITDNKPGMYDLVSRTFFTNAGTGEFAIPT